jgi:hypothetical protein
MPSPPLLPSAIAVIFGFLFDSAIFTPAAFRRFQLRRRCLPLAIIFFTTGFTTLSSHFRVIFGCLSLLYLFSSPVSLSSA